jgi:hypothetical protein
MILAGIAMAATLSFQPIVASFSLGQIQTWLNFFFCAAALAWMSGRKGWAGVLTAAICLVKPQLILLLVWALLRREWRYFWFAAVPFGFVFAASFAAYGLRDYFDYFSLLSFLSAHGEAYHDNQSVNGLLNRLFQNGNNLVWAQASFAPYNPWIHAATVATSAALIGTALFWRRREHERASLVDFLIAALSFTMASPIAWGHHYGIMAAMFAVALPATLGSARFGTGSLVLLAVSYLLSATHLKVTDLTADTSFNFVQSYLFFGAILLLVHLYRLRHAQQDAQASAAPASGPALSGQTAGAGS